MIFVGSGAIHARDEILELAELIDAPVVAFRSGRGIVSNAHELGLTMAAAYRLWPTHRSDDRDRHPHGIADHVRAGRIRPDGLKSIRIDIDPVGNAPVRRRMPPWSPMPKPARATLLAAVRKAGYAKPAAAAPRSARPSAAALRGDPDDPAADGLSEHPARGAAARMPSSPTSCRRSASPPGTAFRSTSRAPSSPRAIRARSARAFRPRSAPRSRIRTGRWSRSPATAASCSACRSCATAVQFNIGVVTLVFNNNAYGNVRRDQRERFDGRVVASDLVNPDFVKLAESFGVARRASPRRIISPRAGKGAGRRRALPDRGRGADGSRKSVPWAFIHPANRRRPSDADRASPRLAPP